MAAISAVLRSMENNSVGFWCPGCQCVHRIPYLPGECEPYRWTWNGDVEKPTFEPSVHIWINRLALSGKALHEALAASKNGGPKLEYVRHTLCHSWVREGRIEFLSDCAHELAGQTVDLPRKWEQG